MPGKWTDEAKAKLSQTLKEGYASGRIKRNKWTDEQKRALSEKQKEKYANGTLVAKKWTDEQKKALSDKLKAIAAAKKAQLTPVTEPNGASPSEPEMGLNEAEPEEDAEPEGAEPTPVRKSKRRRR